MTMFHMSNDSDLFKNESTTDGFPLYEAKKMHQFDHRWATYADSGDTVDVTADQKRDINTPILRTTLISSFLVCLSLPIPP